MTRHQLLSFKRWREIHPVCREWSKVKPGCVCVSPSRVVCGGAWLISCHCHVFAVCCKWKLRQVPPFFYDLFSKQAKIYTDGCECIQDRTEDVFPCFSVTLKTIRYPCGQKNRLYFIFTHTLPQTYLSLWECVCSKGLLESDTVSMDWVKALFLQELLRSVSSLDLGDDGAVTEFWKTGEWHFKANLPTKSDTLDILSKLDIAWCTYSPETSSKHHCWSITAWMQAVSSTSL